MIVKIPLPQKDNDTMPQGQKSGAMTLADKRLWKHIQEAEQDIKRGKVITVPSSFSAIWLSPDDATFTILKPLGTLHMSDPQL